MAASGCTPCACPGCRDITVSSHTRHPELCAECQDNGCEPHNPGHPDYDALPAHMRECQRTAL